jgi:SAM-dependent methyltransferase
VSRARLVARRLLDPRSAREAAAAPIRGAVNIPFAELAARMHELPPADEPVAVAGPDPVVQAAHAELSARGRSVVAVVNWAYGADPPGEVGRLWSPARFLEEAAGGLRPGRALELACGTGRDAVWLAAGGWHVTAVDWLPDALDRGRALERHCAAAIEHPIEWRRVDLEAPDAGFVPHFDLVTIFRYLHRPLLARVAAWLRPGGRLVCETFTVLHRARHGKPARDEHVLSPGELPGLLCDLRIEQYDESWRGARHTARLVARKE